jgi:hypothetical protein
MKQEGLDDMTLLAKVTNDEICSNIKLRYDKDIIYVRAPDSPLCLTNLSLLPRLNPFPDEHRFRVDLHEPLQGPSIYTEGVLEDYIGKR